MWLGSGGTVFTGVNEGVGPKAGSLVVDGVGVAVVVPLTERTTVAVRVGVNVG